MGIIVNKQDLSLIELKSMLKPIIFCNVTDDLLAMAEPINVSLAELLIKHKINRRSLQLEKCFLQLLNEYSGEPIIKDFDVIFNPKYQVDIIKMMISIYKKREFSMIWPGTYRAGKLFYAEEGFLDYKVFKIEEYDVTCIV